MKGWLKYFGYLTAFTAVFCVFVTAAHDPVVDRNGIDVELDNTEIGNPLSYSFFSFPEKKHSISEKEQKNNQTDCVKRIHFESALLASTEPAYPLPNSNSYSTVRLLHYNFLFYREINPPPPRA